MGFFGDVSPTDLTIAYYYQMEVQSNNDSNLILPSLETGISNLILESLFENTSCGVKKNNIFGTRKLDSIASMIVGINSNPTDVITSKFNYFIIFFRTNPNRNHVLNLYEFC
jgi:hypothetical protein